MTIEEIMQQTGMARKSVVWRMEHWPEEDWLKPTRGNKRRSSRKCIGCEQSPRYGKRTCSTHAEYETNAEFYELMKLWPVVEV